MAIANRLAGYRSVDLAVVAVANLMNLIMVAVFALRTMRVEHPQVVGLVWVGLILVLTAVAGINVRASREWWAIALSLLLVVFLIVEVVLDYITEFESRSTILLGPYLVLYYLSALGMIGYSFATEKK